MKILLPESIKDFIAIRDEKEEVSIICDVERCGVLLGHKNGDCIVVEEIVEVENASKNPNEFEIDPYNLYEIWVDAEKRGLDIVAVFHTHPFGLAKPSSLDVQGLKQTGMIWVIIGIDGVKAYIYRNRLEEVEVIYLK